MQSAVFILAALLALSGAQAHWLPQLRQHLSSALQSSLPKHAGKAKVMIVTMGSRGDVVPMVNLCEALKEDIGSCTVVTQSAHSDLVEKRGFSFLPLTDPDSEVTESIALASFYGFASKEAFRWMLSKDFKERFVANYHAVDKHVSAVQPSVVLMNPWIFTQPLIRAKHNIPVITINPFPWKPIDGVPNFAESTYERLQDTRLYNMTVSMHNMMSKSLSKSHVYKLLHPLAKNLSLTREQLTEDLFQKPHIYGYSRFLMDRNFTYNSESYVTGTWAQSSSLGAAEPPADSPQGVQWRSMRAFIEQQRRGRSKLIFMGFGSMEYSASFWATVINRLKDVLSDFPDVAVIYQGPNNGAAMSEIAALPRALTPEQQNHTAAILAFQADPVWQHPRLFRMTGPMPHNLFMPHIEAFVTHGGAGSIATATAHGVPMVVKPFFGDQFAWCNEIAAHNWGSCLSRRFSKAEFETSLRKVFGNAEMKENVRVLHRKIQSEDGLVNFRWALGNILKEWLNGTESGAQRRSSIADLQHALLPQNAVVERTGRGIFITAP